MRAEIEAARQRFWDAAERGVERFLERVHDAAAADVPVGDPSEDPAPEVSLAASGRVTVERTPSGIDGTVGFYTEYAKKVHEQQNLKHPRGGRAKFLETNLLDRSPELQEVLAEELEREGF